MSQPVVDSKSNYSVDQQRVKAGISVYHIVSENPSPDSSSFSGSKQLRIDLDLNELHRIKRWGLEITFAVSAAGTAKVGSIAHGVRRLYLRSGHNDNELYQKHGDILQLEQCLLEPREKYSDSYLAYLGYGPNFSQPESTPASGSCKRYMPMYDFLTLASRLSPVEIASYSRQQMVLHLDCQPIKISGAGVVTVSSVRTIFEEHKVTAGELKMAASLMNSRIAHRGIRAYQIEKTSQTLTASTKYRLRLDQFGGKFVGFAFCIRPDSYSTTNNTVNKFYGLGEAPVDIENGSGQSLMGQVPANYLKRVVFSDHFDSKWDKNMYILPFSRNLKDAFYGRIDGWKTMEIGNQEQLAITPMAAATAAVQTIDLDNAANDGGTYKIAWKGHYTDSLAFNANAATIKAAIEALPPALEYPGRPLEVTVSGAATTDFTITAAGGALEYPDVFNQNLFQLVSESLNDGGIAVAPEFSSTSLTTAGVPGWTSASTYTITVYGLQIADVVQHMGLYKARKTG